MNKKFHMLSILLVTLLLLLSACSNNSNSSSSSSSSSTEQQGNQSNNSETKEEPTEIVMAFSVNGDTPRDLALVEEKINEITREKINTTVKLMVISAGNFRDQVNLMLSGNEQVDLLFTGSRTGFVSQASRGQLLELDDLVEQYGQDIINTLPDGYLDNRLNGHIYAIPTLRDMASHPGFHMRKDLVEKHGIDVNSIKTLDDLESVLRVIKENEPALELVLPFSPGVPTTNVFSWFDNLGDFFGVLPNDSNELKVVNLYETAEYEEFVKTMRRWYNDGLVMSEIATNTQPIGTLYRSGIGFGHLSPVRPGTEGAVSRQAGTPMIGVALGEAHSHSHHPIGSMWAIPRNNTKAPEKAMEFLNLMFVNEELVNLFNWGIEGKHYVKVSDNIVAYPQGVDASNSGYNVNTPHLWGNSFLTYIMEGEDPNLWDDLQTLNENAVKSKAIGFIFDPSSVSTELTALTNVRNEFVVGLESGAMDPERNLPVFIQRLKDAGIDKYIAEKQRQLDEWAKNNK